MRLGGREGCTGIRGDGADIKHVEGLADTAARDKSRAARPPEAPRPVSVRRRICYREDMKILIAAAFIALLAETPLADPDAEARAQNLMREIRCVACENEPVSQSSAAIAEDMRVQIREMVNEGATDTEVRDWFVSRYGDFVLFRPPARDASDWLLWGLPFALLAAGVTTGLLMARKARAKAPDIEAEDV